VTALISIVDDDPEVLKFLEFVLAKAGYAVSTSSTPGRFFDSILKTKPALCLIDVQLPGMDGREIIRVLRASPETRGIPLVAMSAVAVTPSDKVRGLDDGADEYFSKPLDLDFLLLRVANLLARRGGAGASAPPPEIVSWGPLQISIDEHRATLAGKEVPLTHLEMKLLLAFLRQPGRVLPRALLLQSVWNSTGTSTRTVDKHVETLRRKLPPFGKKVETVVGVGYLFRP
jgi:DNA-binding response OmpR family regulator